MTANTLRVPPNDLRDLLEKVTPFVSRDGMFPALETVELRTRGAWITATATDRFRVGIARVEQKHHAADDFYAMIPRDVVRQIRRTFLRRMTPADPPLTLIVDEDQGPPQSHLGQLTVSASGTYAYVDASLTFAVQTGGFPNIETLVRKTLASEPSAEPVIVRTDYLADFRAAGYGPKDMVELRSTGRTRPLVILGGSDFVGLLMPAMYSKTDEAGKSISEPATPSAADEWAEFLAPEEPS